MSSVVPVESWRSISLSNTSSSQGCSHCKFSCITQSKWVLIIFGITLSFLTLLLTFYAIEQPLNQKGPRGLLALSHQMYLWLSGIWEKAFLKILVNNMVYFWIVFNPNSPFLLRIIWRYRLILYSRKGASPRSTTGLEDWTEEKKAGGG